MDIQKDLLQLPLASLMARAEAMTLDAHGPVVTYSRKVFIPLTRLCRDSCHYCTFAATPRQVHSPYLSREEVLAIARAGEQAGCREALFTLGDRPEDRYAAARAYLAEAGHESTFSYLGEMARAVVDETGLLPHLNPGLMGADDYAMLRPHAVSMGIMLESSSERLCAKGGPHFGSPDKAPHMRFAAMEAAGAACIPLTTGLLIGIGETREERLDALRAIRDLHARHHHIQEVIIQNFRAKPGTLMADAPEPDLEDHLWTIAAARLMLGPDMTIQVPPNLNRAQDLAAILRAGANDWGGVSPVTPDHVNPEAPWPHLDLLADITASTGRILRERLAVGPAYVREAERWIDPALRTRVLRAVDGRGLPKTDNWWAGSDAPVPLLETPQGSPTPAISRALEKLDKDELPSLDDIVTLFKADGVDLGVVIAAADRRRREQAGETVTYVVNRNINYTNICSYRCGFCAFSKGSTRSERGPAYNLDLPEIGGRAAEAWGRGATEVCLQGGIHPQFDGHHYLDIVAAVREAAPDIHIHAFSPLEVMHGARTIGMALDAYLDRLRQAGLSTLPGTAAEILCSDVRSVLCPDKLSASEWLQVMRAAHGVGLRSTATIMFGHVETYRHWAEHLMKIRALQEETGGFTEFVPLPFVHMEAPIWRKGQARSGPSYREAMLMHAVARLVLGTVIPNIQVSWVKMGQDGAAAALGAGANDLGGVLMDESITRSAGGVNGQMVSAAEMAAVAISAGRIAAQRTTLYGAMPRRLEPA